MHSPFHTPAFLRHTGRYWCFCWCTTGGSVSGKALLLNRVSFLVFSYPFMLLLLLPITFHLLLLICCPTLAYYPLPRRLSPLAHPKSRSTLLLASSFCILGVPPRLSSCFCCGGCVGVRERGGVMHLFIYYDMLMLLVVAALAATAALFGPSAFPQHGLNWRLTQVSLTLWVFFA